jgi:hypothetical protein
LNQLDILFFLLNQKCFKFSSICKKSTYKYTFINLGIFFLINLLCKFNHLVLILLLNLLFHLIQLRFLLLTDFLYLYNEGILDLQNFFFHAYDIHLIYSFWPPFKYRIIFPQSIFIVLYFQSKLKRPYFVLILHQNFTESQLFAFITLYSISKAFQSINFGYPWFSQF